MSTEDKLNLLTESVLNLTALTGELTEALTDMRLGLLSPNESFHSELWRTLDQAKAHTHQLNDLLNSKS
jgi:hypothetical protein